MSKRAAEAVARHVEELVRAGAAGVKPDASAAAWAASVDGRIRKTLEGWQLIDPINPTAGTDAGRLLGPFLDAYIADRSDIGTGTATNYGQARRLLMEYFDTDRSLSSITPADADRFRAWLLSRPVAWDDDGNVTKRMAKATVSKHIKRTKTMFNHAVRDGLLDSSPFADQKGGNESNKDRHHFVDRQTTAAVLDACPDHDWRMVFALARFAGMRCPSEVTRLQWSDVLWDSRRLRIESPKTGLRFCPIFPELAPLLDAAFADAPEGARYVVGRYGGGDAANLSTQLKRIIERAGCIPWPKTFINLARSTRRTELQNHHPSHVVDAWLGHDYATAAKHYLQVTPDHWEAGVNLETAGGVLGGVITADPGQSGDTADDTARPKTHEKTRQRLALTGVSVTPMGLEPMLPP